MRAFPVLYSTISRKELRPELIPPQIPVLLSAASFVRQRKNGSYHLLAPRVPATITERGADCGGFVVSTRWGAAYRFRPKQYVDWLRAWHPQWAAIFDLCCFDAVSGKKGLRLVYPGAEVVKARQRFATEMADHFWIRARLFNWAWVPTIHGYSIAEYEAHARVLAPLIRQMMSYYSDPATTEEGEACAFRVGIGSLAGRARLPFLLEVIERVQLTLYE